MKDAGRDNADGQRQGQAKPAPKSAGPSPVSLEVQVAQFLATQQNHDSLGEFSRKLGIPRQSLSRYLRAEQSMTLATLQKIANALGVTCEEILGKDERRVKHKQ